MLDDRHRRARVAGEVPDLVGRRGVVDRDRRRPEQEHRDVGDVELGPVADQHHDAVAGSDPDDLQPGREAGGLVGVVTEGEGANVVAGILPQRHLIVTLGDRAEESGRDRVGPRATLSTSGGGQLPILGGKPRRDGEYWREFVPRRSLGHRFRACFSTPTPLGTNSRPGCGLNNDRGTGRYRPMLPARALVAGAVVTVFLVPATAGYAQESSTTTTTRRRPPPPFRPPRRRRRRARHRPRRPPTPTRSRRLANQVSQNQAMLAQLTAQVDADDATTGRAGDRDRRDPAEARRHPRRNGAAQGDRARRAPRTSTATRTRRRPQSSTSSTCATSAPGKKYAESATQTDGTKLDGALEALGRARRAARAARSGPCRTTAAEGPARQREEPRSRR